MLKWRLLSVVAWAVFGWSLYEAGVSVANNPWGWGVMANVFAIDLLARRIGWDWK